MFRYFILNTYLRFNFHSRFHFDAVFVGPDGLMQPPFHTFTIVKHNVLLMTASSTFAFSPKEVLWPLRFPWYQKQVTKAMEKKKSIQRVLTPVGVAITSDSTLSTPSPSPLWKLFSALLASEGNANWDVDADGMYCSNDVPILPAYLHSAYTGLVPSSPLQKPPSRGFEGSGARGGGRRSEGRRGLHLRKASRGLEGGFKGASP